MSLAADVPPVDTEDEVDAASRFRRAIEGVIGVPATEGNHIDVLRNGDEIFPAMLGAIRDAQHTVDLLTFVYWKGDVGRQFARALAKRAAAGVRVGSSRVDLQACKLEYSIVSPK